MAQRVPRGRRGLLVFSLAIPLLFMVAPPACPNGGTLRPDEYSIVQASEGIVHLFRKHAGDIWPGYDLSRRPFIVYVPERWVLLFNCLKEIEGFGPCPQQWPKLDANVLYREGSYGNLVGQLAFDVAVDSTVTFAAGFPEDFVTSFDNPGLFVFGHIVHEGFHQYQREAFGEIQWAREERYPLQDTGNSALAYIEMRILIDALEAMSTGDRERCRELVRIFAAVRSHRWERTGPLVTGYEQGQEINEGTARYVELRSTALMKDFEYESSIGSMTNPLGESFRSISMPGHLIDDFRDRMREGFVPPEDMPRNRIYPVGSAQGFLLDYLGVDWKAAAQQAGTEFTYCALLNETAGGMDARESERLLGEAMRAYEYDAVRAATSRSIDEYKAGYEKELAAFREQAGCRMEVDFYYRSISRSRSGRAKKWIVDNGTWTLSRHFDVYTLENDDLTLQLHNAGVLEKNDWDKKRKTVVFYVTASDSLFVDGKAAQVREDFNGTFETVELRGANVRLIVRKPGTITALHGDITVTMAH